MQVYSISFIVMAHVSNTYYVTGTENKMNKPSPSSRRASGSGEGGRGDLHREQLFYFS